MGLGEKIVSYVVLPVGALIVLFFIITNLPSILGKMFSPDQWRQVKEAGNVVHSLIIEYKEEARAFLENDGVIDANEQAILDQKEQWIDDALDAFNKSINDPTLTMIATATAVSLAIGGLSVFYLLVKNWKTNWGKPDPGTNNSYSYVMITGTELAMFSRLLAISDIANTGNITLASQAFTATQTLYFNATVPKFQTQYNALISQIPNLSGVNLAFAQMQIMQFAMYLQFYQTAPYYPPLITFMPPL